MKSSFKKPFGRFFILVVFIFSVLVCFQGCGKSQKELGQNEALRIYVEFADGSNRGIYNHETGKSGFPDENYDATTAMVINWHKMPEVDTALTARLQYRSEYPEKTGWKTVAGSSFEFWYRSEKINRVILKNLKPNTVYAFKVKKDGEIFRFRTMPSGLDQRPVKLVFTSDHQSPKWNEYAHANAKMAAAVKPDMFLAIGDFVSDEGVPNENNAERWVTYLDNLYGIGNGYFIYDSTIDDKQFSNLIIPHVAILGNHDTGDKHHIRWPADLNNPDPGYPMFTAANWLELMFHFPYKSEGFFSEFRPEHPNINPETVKPGFGQGGFGKLSFSDYLMIIALDNGSQNWEGVPDTGLRDLDGELITDKWAWFEKQFSDVRQDIWLRNLLEPANGQKAGDKYEYILPFWHRGLFGSARFNMSYKNRGVLEYWLPVLYRNGARFFVEAHDHLYTRTVPMSVSDRQPENSYIEKVYYQHLVRDLPPGLSGTYRDDFFSVNCIRDIQTDEITGWEYKGNYITYSSGGMRAFGHGGWAAGRRQVGDRGAGNAGWWFTDPQKGGEKFSGELSYHINVVTISPEGLLTEAFDSGQLEKFEKGLKPEPIHSIFWDNKKKIWSDQ